MADTFNYTPKPDGSFWTLEELNQFFATLQNLINQKLDVRGGTLYADLIFTGRGGIINLKDPTSGSIPGEVVPRENN